MSEVRSAPRRYTRPIEQGRLKIALIGEERPLQVFIAGPYISRQDNPEPLQVPAPPAALRIRLIDETENNLKHTVVLGEHRGVLEIGHEQLRTRASALVTEMILVNNSDAVVVLPSSPGSFSELGSWVPHDHLCRKMLILADERFRNDVSYLNLGVFVTAQHHGARLEWVDYADQQKAVEHLTSHLASIREAVITRQILGVR